MHDTPKGGNKHNTEKERPSYLNQPEAERYSRSYQSGENVVNCCRVETDRAENCCRSCVECRHDMAGFSLSFRPLFGDLYARAG